MLLARACEEEGARKLNRLDSSFQMSQIATDISLFCALLCVISRQHTKENKGSFGLQKCLESLVCLPKLFVAVLWCVLFYLPKGMDCLLTSTYTILKAKETGFLPRV